MLDWSYIYSSLLPAFDWSYIYSGLLSAYLPFLSVSSFRDRFLEDDVLRSSLNTSTDNRSSVRDMGGLPAFERVSYICLGGGGGGSESECLSICLTACLWGMRLVYLRVNLLESACLPLAFPCLLLSEI